MKYYLLVFRKSVMKDGACVEVNRRRKEDIMAALKQQGGPFSK